MHAQTRPPKTAGGGIDAARGQRRRPRLKAYALNRAIEQAQAILRFLRRERRHRPGANREAALLMWEKTTTPSRHGPEKRRSILSEFLLIDTAFWFRKYIPFVLAIAQGMPLSGEGLFVRTSVLKRSRWISRGPDRGRLSGDHSDRTRQAIRVGLVGHHRKSAEEHPRAFCAEAEVEPRVSHVPVAAHATGLPTEAEVRPGAAVPDAAQLLAGVPGMGADSRSVGPVGARRHGRFPT